MKRLMIVIALLTLSACSSVQTQEQLGDHEQKVLSRHVDKSSTVRGTFCDGEGFRWYHEGVYYIQFTCKDGSVFSLRK